VTRTRARSAACLTGEANGIGSRQDRRRLPHGSKEKFNWCPVTSISHLSVREKITFRHSRVISVGEHGTTLLEALPCPEADRHPIPSHFTSLQASIT